MVERDLILVTRDAEAADLADRFRFRLCFRFRFCFRLCFHFCFRFRFRFQNPGDEAHSRQRASQCLHLPKSLVDQGIFARTRVRTSLTNIA